MDKNDINTVASVKVTEGVAFVIKAGGHATPIKADYLMSPDDVVVTHQAAEFVLLEDGIPVLVNHDCPNCIILSGDGVKVAELKQDVAIPYGRDAAANFSDDDINAIQNAILAGEDPTQVFEATAAGNEQTGTSNTNATVVEYDNDQMLAEAGFDTANEQQETEVEEERLGLTLSKGGESADISLIEGDLSDGQYPVEVIQVINIEAGSLPLDPGSFTFDPTSINVLLDELNQEITSGGESVDFTFDPVTNSIVGIQEGLLVLTIDLEVSSSGSNVTVQVTTTLHQPVDHDGDNNSGLVTYDNDLINIAISIQGADAGGNALENPIDIKVGIVDGGEPSFSTDSGVIINETTQQGEVVKGQVPLDLGSDEIGLVEFQQNQPSLSGIISNGRPTTYQVVGNTITVLDSESNPIMTITVMTDGSYDVLVSGPIDQSDSESSHYKLNFTATDSDGDQAEGTLSITIIDGDDAAGSDTGSVALTEGDLDTLGNGTNPADTDTSYPASQSGSFVIKAGEDKLVPGSVKIDPAQQADLIAELQAELTSGDEALTFTVDSDGNLIGKLPNGETALTVSLSAIEQGQDVKVTVNVVQHVPLDNDGTSTTGYVTFTGDDIHINLPVQAEDTDGDDLT
ncbi:retention module-containing protein, partial [Photobacterium sp. BZF1]|uniref:retention module-containing protein n=1 Tax=Photobacterium sp. BZF1 TaxID=1904457 RepID=UPI001653AE87